MDKNIKVKPVFNKKNGQINFSLPKRKIPKNLKDELGSVKELDLKISKVKKNGNN